MRNGNGCMLVGALVPAALVVAPVRATAAETRGDVESDHLDAADDGGPRAMVILVHPWAVAQGEWGGEVDVALQGPVALSVEGDLIVPDKASPVRLAVGLPLFVQHLPFHGLYVHPSFEWVGRPGSAGPGSAIGGAAVVGYEWTWPFGATVRAGAGAVLSRSLGSSSEGTAALPGVRPRLDASLGWVF